MCTVNAGDVSNIVLLLYSNANNWKVQKKLHLHSHILRIGAQNNVVKV